MRSAGILLCDRVRMSNEPTAGPVRAAQERKGADYAGAVYGSLLAASVVAGTSPRKSAPSPTELILLLLATGIVFWLTHVFAQLFGDRMEGTALTLKEFRAVATREAPIIQAAVPPALAAGIGALLGRFSSHLARAPGSRSGPGGVGSVRGRQDGRDQASPHRLWRCQPRPRPAHRGSEVRLDALGA